MGHARRRTAAHGVTMNRGAVDSSRSAVRPNRPASLWLPIRFQDHFVAKRRSLKD